MNTNIHLTQYGFFKPIVDTLRHSGVNVDNLFQKSGLHHFDLGDSENHVPVNLMYKFLDEAQRSQGIDEFLGLFANQIELSNVKDFGEIIALAPNFLSACQFAIKNVTRVLTHERMTLDVNGSVCKLSQWYVDGQKPGKEFADYIDLCYLVNATRIAAGDNWAPLEIHLQSHEAPDFDNLLPNLDSTRVLMGQPTTAVTFPTEILKEPMLKGDPPESNEIITEHPGDTLLHTIEKLLGSSKNGQIANMTLIADMFDTTPRTMRRRLDAMDTTFSEVVDNWRFKSCITLLEDERLRVSDIAERLGYANISNFERAFKRWTNQTPGSYRDNH